MLLRPLVSTDSGEFIRVLRASRSHWAPWIPARAPGLSDAEAFDRELGRAARGAEAGTHLRLAGFMDSGELIGLFSLNEIVRGVFESAYASWQVSADHLGEGLATEGARALLDIAFGPSPGGLGLHRVQANVMPGNAASIRVAEKVGFRREGTAKLCLRIAGRWEDHLMFATTVEDRIEEGAPSPGG